MVQEAAIPEPHPRVDPSCQLATGEYAEPPVRIQQWVNAFGSRGMAQPICADSLAPAFQTIGQVIGERAGAMCVSGPFPATAGRSQPNCRVADLEVKSLPGAAGQIIPNCGDNGGVDSCWTLVDDPVRCGNGTQQLVVNRVLPDPPSTDVGFTCDPCPSNVGEILGCSI